MHKRRIMVLIAGAMVALATALGAAPAGAHVHPDFANGQYNIVEANGNNAVWAASPLDAGEPVTEVTGLGRIMTFTKSGTYSGDDAGLFSFSNGNVLAMNNACTWAVVKAASATFGTVWALKFTGIAHTYWVISRACDQGLGSHDTVSLAGFNRVNAQFTSCGSPPQDCGGLFLKMTLAPA